MDALQEISVLTSNFSAEYGQVGGGFFNYVVKSGTNDFHGSAYDYAANDAFNAATPWLNTKSPVRRHDYGFTVGGPVFLTKKIYDGHNKTFFFFNFEQYRDHQNISTIANTVPIQEYRDGNFSKAITGKDVIALLGPQGASNPVARERVLAYLTDRQILLAEAARIGLALTVIESVLLLLVVPFYWPLIGI